MESVRVRKTMIDESCAEIMASISIPSCGIIVLHSTENVFEAFNGNFVSKLNYENEHTSIVQPTRA